MKFDPHQTYRAGYTTRTSHLRRLADMEDAAWKEFYSKYRAMIAAIGKRHDLTPEDCDDLMQQVTSVMCDRLRDFVYEPEKCRFRSFLYRVAENLSCNMRRKLQGSGAVSAPLPEYAESELDRAFMEEYEDFLLARSLDELKRSMESGAYLAFEMLVVEKRPVAEVAAITGKTAGALYSIRHRGLKKLRDIIADLQASFCEKRSLARKTE